jgi:ribonucleoside-diphosphate reductase alpha chain
MKIKSIKKSGVKPTWDIEVNDVHEYLLENGCVSHNTASILGNEASCEAQTSNMYTRGVLSGTFIIVNKYLVRELIKQGIWSDTIRRKIITENGSIQNIPEIPTNLKEIFKTVYEIKQKDVIDMAADRGAFIDQTQSMNIFMDSPNFAKLTSMHFYGWGRRSLMKDENGKVVLPQGINIDIVYDKDGNPRFYRDRKFSLKTGMYYLRNKGATDAVKFTVQNEKTKEKQVDDIEIQMSEIACSLDSPDDCISCSG